VSALPEAPCHDTDSKGRPYVRLTYKPEGATRATTVWAIVLKRGPKRTTYLQCDREGETRKDGGMSPKGEAIEQIHMIIVGDGTDAKERPARMNLRYAELELIPKGKK
jgi:hypothetical protein